MPTGKDAYRVAFTILPDFCVNITGNRAEIWVEYWNNHELRERIENSVIELKTNMDEIVEGMASDLKALLPHDVDMGVETHIHFILDGYAGAFFQNNHIVFDLLEEVFTDFSFILSALAHELHHVFYGSWLIERLPNIEERNQGERLLIDYQIRFIIEGIATRYDFPFRSQEVKQMFANRELMAELFDEWISVMRGLIGNNPRPYWDIWRTYSDARSLERLKRFWSGDEPDLTDVFARPCVIYYLSFNVYNLIYESGGHEKLKFVIENPAKLLSVFNELHTECMIVPRVPDDIVMLWKNNLTP
jgi:hypothetical protein